MPGYEVHTDTRSVIHPVELPPLLPAVADQIAADAFTMKDEHHVTVIPASVGDQLADEQLGQLQGYFASLPEPELTFRPSFLYRVAKEKQVDQTVYPREALVARVQSYDITRATIGAYAMLHIPMHKAFLHVTVATRPDNPYASRGIGIDSPREWQDLMPWVYAPEWQ